MNRRGFTLVELLVTISLLALLSTIVVTGIITVMKSSKEGDYKVLISNIETAGKMYYEDCTYGTLVGTDICKNNPTIYTLVSFGFLTTNNEGNVTNPKDNKVINACSITITNNKGKITVDTSSIDEGCGVVNENDK